MRSRVRLTDSMVGLLIATVLVGSALWVWQVCAMHAEQHGHDGARPMFDFEGVQRPEDRAGREVQQGGGLHGSFFATGRLSDAVRRPRTDSDKAL